ncbi:MAG: tRNA (adenosine(37)-N6)-threonylcarbamoyltransferase complex transferase subunit TsaD, partial [Hydrogenophaga sp.]
AEQGSAEAFKFPRPLLHSGDLDFSFAGLKTAVLTQVKRLAHASPDGPATTHLADPLTPQQRADVAASAQAAIVDVLVKKSLAALDATGLKRLVVAGGVGANTRLREQLDAACLRRSVRVHYPELHLCTDNGAMIALAAGMRWQANPQAIDAAPQSHAFDVKPRWPLADLGQD